MSKWIFSLTGDRSAPALGVTLDVREVDSAVYDWTPGTDEAVLQPAPTTTLPDPFTVAAPTGLTLASGTAVLDVRLDGTVFSRILVTWTAPASIFVTSGGWVEGEVAKNSAPTDWRPTFITRGDITQAYVLDVEDGVAYLVRIRGKTILNSASAWTTSSAHTVVGKTEAPSNVSSLTAQNLGNVTTFSWTAITDVDRAGYELRYMATPFTWDNARLISRETKGTLITNTALPPGTWIVGIKAVDSSGNYSTTEATTTVVVVSVNTAIAATTENPKWAGHLSGLIRHDTSGTLIPRSTMLASDMTDAQLYDTFVHSPVISPFYESTEIDVGYDADGIRVYATSSVALGPAEGGTPSGDLYIDYHDAAASYDGFETWPSASTADFRYLKGAIYLDTSNGVEHLDAFTLTTDAEIRTETAAGVVIAASGTAITFTDRFNGVPSVQVTPQGGAALTATVASPTVTGFTAHLFNSAGTDVGGTADWQARGA